MLGGNAAKVYGFDMDLMRRVAVEIEAPTVAEVRIRCRSTRSPTTPRRWPSKWGRFGSGSHNRRT